MRSLILIVLLVFTIGCKEEAKEAGFIGGDKIGNEVIEDDAPVIDLFVEGYSRIPSDEEIQAVYGLEDMDGNDLESKTRPPHYYECRMLENWAVGTDKTFFFEMPDQIDDDGFIFRFDRDGILTYDGINGYREFKIGSCTIGIQMNIGPDVDEYIKWQSDGYLEVVLDIR